LFEAEVCIQWFKGGVRRVRGRREPARAGVSAREARFETRNEGVRDREGELAAYYCAAERGRRFSLGNILYTDYKVEFFLSAIAILLLQLLSQHQTRLANPSSSIFRLLEPIGTQ